SLLHIAPHTASPYSSTGLTSVLKRCAVVVKRSWLRPVTQWTSALIAKSAFPTARSRYVAQAPRPILPISTPRYLYCGDTLSTPSPKRNSGTVLHCCFVPQITTSDLPGFVLNLNCHSRAYWPVSA